MELRLKVTNSKGYPLDDTDLFVFDNRGGTIGRAEANDCTLPDAERFISSQHARITFSRDTFALIDTSTNGVFLNGSNEAVGKNNTVELSSGDCLSIGPYQLLVSIENADERRIKVQSEITAEPKPAEAPPPPWGEFDKHQSKPGVLDGIDRSVKTPNLVGWDTGWDDRDEPSTPFSGQPVSEPDHSPFGQQHYSPPPMKVARDTQNWDRTDFSLPSDLEKETRGLDPAADPEAEIRDDLDASAISSVIKSGEAVEYPDAQNVSDRLTVERDSVDQVSRDQSLDSPDSEEQSLATKLDVAPDISLAEKGGDQHERLAVAESEAVKIFLQAAGLKETYIPPQAVPAVVAMLGATYGEVVQGLMDVLRARSDLKNEFRMRHTQINIAENNPLKFSVSLDEALEHLIFHRNEGFLQPEDAFREALQDIRDHQVAMMAGMQSAFDSLLRRFDPELLDNRVKGESKIGHRLPLNRKASCWDHYEALYAEMSAAAEDDFRGLFGDEFTRAYEEQISRLSLLRRKSDK